MKKTLICLTLAFLISLTFISAAWEFDNVKSYDEEIKTITITNAFGLGDDIAEIKLNTPQVNYVIRGSNRKVAEFTIDNFDYYDNVFNDMEFYNKKNMQEINRNFVYKYKIVKGVRPITYSKCIEWEEVLAVNGTETRKCSKEEEIIRYEEIIEWHELDTKLMLNKGKITIGIFTDVFPNDNIEWIPTFFGEKINEWASWTDSLNTKLISYWTFNESSGTNVLDIGGGDIGNQKNGTLVFHPSLINWTAGLIGNALNCTISGGQTGYVNITNNIAFGIRDNFTIQAWVKRTSGQESNFIGSGTPTNSERGYILYLNSDIAGDTLVFRFGNSIADRLIVSTVNGFPTSPNYYHIVLTYNATATGSGVAIYINGTYQPLSVDDETVSGTTLSTLTQLGARTSGTAGGNHHIDEIVFWNRTLSQSEVTQLYNDGAGINYEFGVEEEISITTNLINPADETSLSISYTNFTANYTAISANFTNATYHIWYSNGSLFNRTVEIIKGTSNETDLMIYNFSIEDYKWNVKACAENTTTTVCNWADANYSFSVGIIIDAESYNNWTYETSNERFEVNISLLPEVTLYLAELYYNKTSYEGNILDLGGNKYSSSINIDVPAITGSSYDFTFHWKLTYEKEDNSFVFQNLTSHNQTVSKIQLGSCNGDLTTVSLNFTAWEEEKLTRINGFDFKATFYYWLGGGTYKKNVSFNNPNIYEKNICINPDNVTYYLINSDIQYQANFSGYIIRNYYFENETINNITQHVPLYLLNSSDSTSFILKVLDQNQRDVENAFIYTQRHYPGLGTYKIVQIAKTDENGKSIGFFKTETVDYRFVIKKNSITELITQKQKVIPEEIPYTLTFTIGVALENPWADFDALEYLNYILIFNSSTNITTFTYIDTSGNFTQGRLLVEEVKYNQTDIIICNVTSSESSATLTCDLNGYSGSFIAKAYIGRSPETIIGLIWAVITTAVEVLGLLGLMLGWFIILVAGCAFFWHPVAGIIGIEASIIFVNIMGLISFSPLFIFGSLAVAAILIFILKD